MVPPRRRACRKRPRRPADNRWPDEVRARLRKLNAERAEEERLAGVAAAAAKPRKARGKKIGGVAPSGWMEPPEKDLFG